MGHAAAQSRALPARAAHGQGDATAPARDMRHKLRSRPPSAAVPGAPLNSYLLLAVFLVLAGCGATVRPAALQRTPSATTTPAIPTAPVRVYLAFSASVPFSHALRLVTDFGIQPAAPCNSAHYIPGSNWREWVPVLLPHFYAQSHQLWAELTPLAPPDWLARLHALPQIAHITTDPDIFGCSPSLDHFGTPPPTAAAGLTRGQPVAVARVTFAVPLDVYDAALYTASNLGLRLADPCGEQGRATPAAGPWQPVGQERGFAASMTLVLATSVNASTRWQQQLRAAQGVQQIETPYLPAC